MKSLDAFTPHRYKRLWSAALALLLSASWSYQAHGQSQQDLLFFTSIDAFKNLSGTNPDVEDSFVRPTVDILYSYSGDRFHFLAEYLWSSDESEMERMKAGWQTGDNSMLWFGRFHSTSKYWTTEYHHGQFLQTSITRPSIDEWEDESGPMPSHITGLSLEHEAVRANESTFSHAISVGLGPKFIGRQLVAFDVLDPDTGHDLAINYRIGYSPSLVSANQVGLQLAWSEIDVVPEPIPVQSNPEYIKQTTIGLYADWSWDKWRVIGNYVYFKNDMQYIDSSLNDEFVAGYVQAEYEASKTWTIFGRSDNGFNEDASPYLRMLPAFIAHRNMIGLRWDFASFQSFTVEIADASAQGDGLSHNNYKEARIQWSAVIP